MTNEMLAKTRKSYLTSLKDPQVSAALLGDLFAQAEHQTPALISAYEPDTGKNALDPDQISWNAEYFSRHILLAEHNFARERIEHLLAVREYLRKQGVKGFVPSAPASRANIRSTQDVTSNYIPSANLQSFVKEGDLLTLRTALRMELNDNSLSAGDLRAALAWVKSQNAGLLEAFSDKSYAQDIDTDSKLWTSSYYEHQVVYLKTNFAEKRFLHLIEVREHLRQQGVKGFVAIAPKSRASTSADHATPARALSQHQSSRSQHSSAQSTPSDRNPAFKTALLIGGAVAALVVFLITLAG